MDEPLEMDEIVIQNVTVWSMSNQCFSIPITIETDENTEKTRALMDSGAKGLFIDVSYAGKWRKHLLKYPIRVCSIDGSININGEIKEKCLIMFRCGDEEMTEWFLVTATGDQDLILGLPWLTKWNPIIDWREKTLEFCTSNGTSKSCKSRLTAKLQTLSRKWEVEDLPATDEDLVVWYLSCNESLSPQVTQRVWDGDDLDCLQWKEQTFDAVIRKFTMAQKIDQKY